MRCAVRRTVRLTTLAAVSVLVVALAGAPAAAHAEEFDEAPPRGLIHLLTQWDHLAALVLGTIVVGALVATLRGSRNQAD